MLNTNTTFTLTYYSSCFCKCSNTCESKSWCKCVHQNEAIIIMYGKIIGTIYFLCMKPHALYCFRKQWPMGNNEFCLAWLLNVVQHSKPASNWNSAIDDDLLPFGFWTVIFTYLTWLKLSLILCKVDLVAWFDLYLLCRLSTTFDQICDVALINQLN